MHVGAFYLSSPTDIADALLLVAPTPFSVCGVIGFADLALIVVVYSIALALLIEGGDGECVAVTPFPKYTRL